MLKRLLVWSLVGAMCACMLAGCSGWSFTPGSGDPAARVLSEYERYITDRETVSADTVIEIAGTDFSAYAGPEPEIRTLDGRKAAATGNEGSISYTFRVEKAGLYNLAFDYYPLEGYGSTIERVLYLDGKIPYSEARSILLQRQFADEGEKRYSVSGNEYRRSQKEIYEWFTTDAHSGYGFIDAPLKLYLEPGEHTITLEAISEPVAIGALRLYGKEELPSYAEALKRYQAAGLTAGQGQLTFEAEDASRKSDSTLYAVEDRSSCVTTPYESTLILLNCIGSNNWKHTGQWIEWTVNAPADGLYQLSFRVKQDFVSGASATRRLSVNGKVPFAEAENLAIPYDLSWQIFTPGNEDGAFLFPLQAGDNTIRLEVVTGELAPILIQVRETVNDLTALYRRINAIDEE